MSAVEVPPLAEMGNVLWDSSEGMEAGPAKSEVSPSGVGSRRVNATTAADAAYARWLAIADLLHERSIGWGLGISQRDPRSKSSR